MESLRLVNLEPLAEERAKNLSGGQKKLLELARALMNSPRLLLLDEPTAGVNPTLARELAQHLVEVSRARELTLLMVSHDMATVRAICDHVIVMAGGKVLTEGTPDEVSDDPLVQRAYLGAAE